MDKIQIRRYEMLVRVRDFETAHADLFPDSSLAHQTFATVADAVQQLSAHTVSKLSTIQGMTAKATARTALADRLAAISQTARVIAAHTPGLEEKFVVPADPSDQVLLMTARVFAQDAAPLADQFIAHVMPKTFLADLETAIGQLEQAIHDRVAGRDERIAAKANIAAMLESGLSAVKALDAIMANRLRDDPATMAVWQHDRRVLYPNRPRSIAAAAAPAAGPTPAPAPAPPATPSADARSGDVTTRQTGTDH